MSIDSPEAKSFLFELYNQTQGDLELQVSMYDVGATLGLDQDESGALAQDLFIQGMAEMKTLSGGIGITHQGMKALDIKVAPKPGDELLELGRESMLDEAGTQAVLNMLQEIKTNMFTTKTAYEKIETLIIDIKTIEVQMLSPQPKTQVIRELFRSIHATISEQGPEELVSRLGMLVDS